MNMIRSAEQIREELDLRGISISKWARARGFSAPLVYQVLSGERRAVRGQSHDIAVALGLKNGKTSSLDDLPF